MVDSARHDSSTAADLVRSARARRGLSQRELARLADVPQSTVANIESGGRQPSVTMLERLLAAAGFRLETTLTNTIRPSVLLERRRSEVARVLTRYPIEKAWVFGSVARGDDRPGSDLDLLVALTDEAQFDDYVDLADEIAAALGCPVDVVTTKELASNELLQRRVNRDLRPLEVAA
ncbi:hypothetical protein CLV30_101423 [Haloactinopolyspora alba]|uniref:HTH cro/C1-type domain-containing protein n=1 Tax=Haloactinopolyspora alba TaxID=648780 RepID=A0A2P8EG63_9ACTN|nr:helix-turn-helix domain-containing protein [Haloactinopolyspora alba]PSL08451.1 hypothetical protein CLV30_101423 [Haloactinopolyspora alba]